MVKKYMLLTLTVYESASDKSFCYFAFPELLPKLGKRAKKRISAFAVLFVK